MTDSEKCSNRLQLDLIIILVNYSCALGPIMIRYDLLEARRMILNNVGTYSIFTYFHFICIGANNDQI